MEVIIWNWWLAYSFGMKGVGKHIWVVEIRMYGLDNGCQQKVWGYWLMASALGAAVASKTTDPVCFSSIPNVGVGGCSEWSRTVILSLLHLLKYVTYLFGETDRMLRDLLADECGMQSVFRQTQGFQISLNHSFLLEGRCLYIIFI